jgi:hypothetical protein
VLRGLFERERSLLSLTSQTAYASILRTFQQLLGRKDVRPGCVLSLQTYGAYGSDFHPHCHGLANVYLNPESIAGISPASRPQNSPGSDWSEPMSPSPGEISLQSLPGLFCSDIFPFSLLSLLIPPAFSLAPQKRNAYKAISNLEFVEERIYDD